MVCVCVKQVVHTNQKENGAQANELGVKTNAKHDNDLFALRDIALTRAHDT